MGGSTTKQVFYPHNFSPPFRGVDGFQATETQDAWETWQQYKFDKQHMNKLVLGGLFEK